MAHFLRHIGENVPYLICKPWPNDPYYSDLTATLQRPYSDIIATL